LFHFILFLLSKLSKSGKGGFQYRTVAENGYLFIFGKNFIMLKILILDDELPICRGIELFLTQKGYDATIATMPSEALEQLNKSTFDILILDFKLPEMNGLAFMSVVKEKFSDIEIIMISGHGDMPRVIEAFRLGAIDFIPKPFSLTDIDVSIQRTGKFIELSNKLKISEGKTQKFLELKKRESTHGLIYASEAMKNVVNLIHLIADVEEVPVLITGESGTGKELVARKIFQTGSRRHNAFVTANCAAIPLTNNLLFCLFFVSQLNLISFD